MRGTVNTTASFVTGNTLPPDQVNDGTDLIVSADDDAIFDLVGLEPPAAATPTNVNKGFMPLRRGRFILGDTGARQLTVQALRAGRSSTSNTYPREMLSGVYSSETVKALPTAPAGGATYWGVELLYAQLAYVDASNPTKGTTISINWATSPVYVAVGAAANFATLPADTSTTWNIPLAYVKNFFGQTACNSEDIIEFPSLSGGTTTVSYIKRLSSARTNIDARRGYSNAENNPTRLTLGGASKWVATGKEQVLTSTITPVSAGRSNVEYVRREFLIPYCPGTGLGSAANGTAGTTGTPGVAVATIILDDTRDWRGANFRTEMWCPNVDAIQFAEEDPTVVQPRTFPIMATNGSIAATCQFVVVGQSWTNTTPEGTGIWDNRRWAAIFGNVSDIPGIGPVNIPAATPIAAGDGMGIWVDTADGFLKWYVKKAGTGTGFPAWILLEAWFGHHIPQIP